MNPQRPKRPQTAEQTIWRLDPRVYAELEKKIGSPPVVGPSTTELEAGYKLGVQYVLKILRDGFVTG